MNNIEIILKLMQPELNEIQLAKLKNVLETILRTTKPIVPNDVLIDRFIQHKKIVGLKDTTMARYVSEARQLSDTMQKNFAEMTTADIKDYLADYTKEHKIQATTLQSKIRAISAMFEFLANEEYIDKNPVSRIERVMVEKKIKKAFSEEDIEAMRNACIAKRDRALIEFFYSTGARLSEVLALNVRDVNFDDNEVIVFGKGHKERICYLSNTAAKYLKEYLEERYASLDEPLFMTASSRHCRLSKRGVEVILKDVGERAGVENVHPHRFRRTVATHAMERGMPIEQIKEMLGHAKLDTTMLYCNVNREKVKASFNDIFD